MISEHFKREEFECRCGCGFDTVDYELIIVLEDVRDWAGHSVYINSGCRCVRYNAQVGGSERSQHMNARGGDIQVSGKTPREVYEYLDERYPNRYGIGSYETFTHIDTRANKARW